MSSDTSATKQENGTELTKPTNAQKTQDDEGHGFVAQMPEENVFENEEDQWSLEIDAQQQICKSEESQNNPEIEDTQNLESVVTEKCEIIARVISDFAENSREQWFLQKTNVILFHDEILTLPAGRNSLPSLWPKPMPYFG